LYQQRKQTAYLAGHLSLKLLVYAALSY
jgi:hypothetical protein